MHTSEPGCDLSICRQAGLGVGPITVVGSVDGWSNRYVTDEGGGGLIGGCRGGWYE